MGYWWLIQLVIAFAFNVIAIALQPKPKTQKPDAARDLESPTAEAGRPVPVVFGTITVTGPNVLWYDEKSLNEYEINV